MASQHQTDGSPTVTADAKLEISELNGGLRTVDISGQGCVIGRSEEASVRLPDDAVSRRHAEVFRDPQGRWWLRDLGSVNGTRVNGQLVGETRIAPADRIAIGRYTLRLLLEDELSSATSVRRLSTTSYRSLPVNDADNARISVLGEVAAPKIDTTHLTTINEFAHRISQIQDETKRLGELCRLMVRQAFHGWSAVALRLSRTDEGAPPDVLHPPEIRRESIGPEPYLSRSLLKVVRQTGSPALAAHQSTDPGAVKMTMVSHQPDAAAVACPFGRTEESIDVIYVTLPASYGTGEWLTLIAHAAQTFEQIESALEAQRQLEARAAIERDLTRASQIQQGLVPRRLQVEGFQIAIGFSPCRWVAGDYVDVLSTPDGRTLLAIADVCGKGLPAAMISSTVHSVVHAFQRTGLGLTDMMNSLNDHLCQFLEEAAFVTMVCMSMDPASGEFELVNAGHPPPLIVSPAGEVGSLQEGANYPLGIMPFEVVTERGVLEPGHLLGLFTDGLTELTDEQGRELGVGRIADHIRELYIPQPGRPATPEEVATGLRQVLDDYRADRSQLDDQTFLLVRRA